MKILTLTCKTCGREQPEDQFNRDRSKKTGRRNHCRMCENEKIRERRANEPEENKLVRRARSKAFRQQHPDKFKASVRNAYLKKQYGIIQEDYEYLLKKQHGLCAVCETPPETNRRLAVDHDHDTGAVRGLLCFDCNTSIGKMNDDPVMLRKAAIYLEESSRS